MRPDGFVLAGGRSSRMGFDKARACYRGQPLALAVLSTLEPLCGRRALIRRGPPDGLPWRWADGTAVEVLRERVVAGPAGPHPLWGVAAALEASQTPVALILPCDTPSVSADTLAELIARAPAVAEGPQRRHPLIGAFPRYWAARAASAAAQGGSVTAFAASAAPVPAAPVELSNLNDLLALGATGQPVAALLQGLSFLDAGARARVAQGERARLAARGMLDPGPDPAVPSSRGGEDR